MSALPETRVPVLIVEDDASTAELERRALHRSGRLSMAVSGVRDALDALKQRSYIAILLDYRLPDGEPWPVLEAAQRAVPRIPVILVTAMGDEKLAAEVLHRGGADYVIKTPGFWDQLAGALDRVLRLAEAEQTNARLAAIVESSDDAILSKSLDGTILSWNPGAERLFGYTAQEAIGRPAAMLLPEGWPSEEEEIHDRGRGGDGTRQLETVRVRRDGTRVDVSVTVFPILDGAEQVIGSGIVSRDITRRKRAEAALRESEERHRALFDGNPLAMWLFERETERILAVNDAAVRQYGYLRHELLAMTIRDLVAPDGAARADAVREADASAYRHAGVWPHVRKDGSVLQVDVHVQDVTIGGRTLRLALLADVTERARLEAQLRQSQKLEAVGQLAGGIAHDFNNIVTIINGYSDLMIQAADPGDPRYEDLAEIRAAGERAAGLTRQLLAFSRKQKTEPRVLDLNGVVGNLDRMLRRLIGEHITLRTDLRTDIGLVNADPGQLEQVIVNLAVNARDAMPEGGTLTVETSRVRLAAGYPSSHAGVEEGDYVLLTVSDTGTGMDKEVLSHIFEPFFTTKEPGLGTGLGLATVFGIVKQSGGHVYAYSEPGQGTTFKIYLPCVEGAAAEPARGAVAPSAGRAGAETILVVEDDDAVRKFARQVLERAGYTVLEAPEPSAGIEIARGHAGRIDILVSDVVMPRMKGPALAREITAVRPGIRVLFLSGYTGRAVTEQGGLDPAAPFLEKPFPPDSLLRKVREVLDGAK